MAWKKKQKSGDSKLQDAETADKASYRESAERTARENTEALAEELQDSVEKKKAAGASTEAQQVSAAALTALTKALELMDKRMAAMESKSLTPAALSTKTISSLAALLYCSTCRQYLKNAQGRGVCNGDHVRIFVGPKDMDLWHYFQPVYFNSVMYYGFSWVPREIADPIIARVNRWAAREKRKFIKGGKVFGEDTTIESANAQVGKTPIIAPGQSQLGTMGG